MLRTITESLSKDKDYNLPVYFIKCSGVTGSTYTMPSVTVANYEVRALSASSPFTSFSILPTSLCDDFTYSLVDSSNVASTYTFITITTTPSNNIVIQTNDRTLIGIYSMKLKGVSKLDSSLIKYTPVFTFTITDPCLLTSITATTQTN